MHLFAHTHTQIKNFQWKKKKKIEFGKLVGKLKSEEERGNKRGVMITRIIQWSEIYGQKKNYTLTLKNNFVMNWNLF